MADRWEADVYTVVEQSNPDIPVYIVQTESRTGGKRCRQTLHRNHLLPVGDLLSLDTVSDSVVDTAVADEKEVVSESSDLSESDEDIEVRVMDGPAAAAETVPSQSLTAEADASESSSDKSDDNDENARRNSPDPGTSEETDTADEAPGAAPERRYPPRERHPPDRYQAMTQSAKRLDIVHDLVKLLNKD